MGLFRVLLAIGVIGEHSGVAWIVGSFTAVQAFFIASGFYMSLILSSGSYSLEGFFKSRFFRLFPLYWIALLLVAIYYFIATQMGISTYAQRGFESIFSADSDALTQIWYVISSLFLVGGDFGYFFERFEKPAVIWLPMIPMWTLALELYFYALCPLLNKLRTRWLVALVVASVALRLVAFLMGFDSEPWHARFFPFELAFFVAGMVAHRIYAQYKEGKWFQSAFRHRLLPFAMLAGLSLFFYPLAKLLDWPAVYGQQSYFLSVLYLLLAAYCVPLMFHHTGKSRLDAYIGEYSYPIYIFHYAFVEILLQSQVIEFRSVLGFLVVAGLSVGHSAVVMHFVQAPIDRFRHRRYKKGTSSGSVFRGMSDERAVAKA